MPQNEPPESLFGSQSPTKTSPDKAIAKNVGQVNSAPVPVASTRPVEVPVKGPASDETTKALEMARILAALFWTATKTVPSVATVSPYSYWPVKVAAVAAPLAPPLKPCVPEPAYVDVVWAASAAIFRIRMLATSDTYNTPVESMAIPCGIQKRALDPAPFANDVTELSHKPAYVDTTAVERFTARTQLGELSNTYSAWPFGAQATE